MVLNKWGVAILQFVIFILTTYTLLNADAVVDTLEWWQFGGMFVAQVGVVLVPLASGTYAAILKVSVAAGGAAFQAIVLIVDTANGGTGWSSQSVIVVALAVANAVAVHFGVQARIDTVKQVLASPLKPSQEARAVDPAGVKAAIQQGAPVLEVGLPPEVAR